MYSPIVLFAYNRLEHLKKTIAALCKAKLCNETDLFIYSDKYLNDKDKYDVEAVRKYLGSFVNENCSFKTVKLILAVQHKGLACSVIEGVSEVIKDRGRAIVLEDDLVVSPDFLEYMNSALDFYETENIWSISGYSFPMKSLKKYSHDIFYSYRASSWGWATWSNRWNLVDWDVLDYSNFIKDRKWIRKFNRGGNDLTYLLNKQMAGERDSWAIRWCFAQCKQEMFTIYPKNSKVINIGCDGSGTHCHSSYRYKTSLAENYEKCNFEILKIEHSIAFEFYLKYSETIWKKIARRYIKIKELWNGSVK